MASMSQGALSPDQFGTIGALAKPVVPQKATQGSKGRQAPNPGSSAKPTGEAGEVATDAADTGGMISAAADANGIFKITSLAAAL